MFLQDLHIVLVHARFPENIGMTARACANMACPNLILVKPQRWNMLRAEALATPQGLPVLRNAALCASLQQAIAPMNLVIGSTARTGGWRKKLCSPEEAAEKIVAALQNNEKAALVFGPEDKGLVNEEIILCHDLARIPTASSASSLNLAQAVLIMLYECLKASKNLNLMKKINTGAHRKITVQELEFLEKKLKDILTNIDCGNGRNSDYYFIQWHNLLCRAGLERHEFDALMGFCRQLENRLDVRNRKNSSSPDK